MSHALSGEELCLKHQGNHSHYAQHNCTICKLEAELITLQESKDKYITELSQQLSLANKNALNLAKQHRIDEVKLGQLNELKEEKRMWFDRYASLYATCAMHNLPFTDGEKKIFGKWAMEVDEEYKV